MAIPGLALVGGWITHNIVFSPATVEQIISTVTPPTATTQPTSTSATPAPVTVVPSAPETGVTRPVFVPPTIVDQRPLPAGQTGTITAKTARWLVETGEELSDIGPSILAFDEEVELSGSLSGHFWRAKTQPPVYIQKWAISPITAPKGRSRSLTRRRCRPSSRLSPRSRWRALRPDPSANDGKLDELMGEVNNTSLGLPVWQYTWRQALAWWQAYAAAPFDTRLTGYGVSSKCLTPEQMAMFRQVGTAVLPPPPTSFPFPLLGQSGARAWLAEHER